MMDPVPLEKNLVDRFKDKTMAVIGYEMDQVDGSRVLKHCDLIIDYHFVSYIPVSISLIIATQYI